MDLPIYPRAFVAAAKLHREYNRVFVAMPFDAPHSKKIWRLIQNACEIHDLIPRRADSAQYPRPIVADILEELEKAEIIIADLTGLNPNVLYELGIAHVRCDSVVMVCERGKALPFDLASIRCIFYDLSSPEGKEEFGHSLGRMLEGLKQPAGMPTVIPTQVERTKSVIADLKLLADLPDEELQNETIWFSGFLSSFAISEEEPFDSGEQEYKGLLLEERDMLLKLARRGCSVRCIITPPSKDDDRLPHALHRLRTLIAFLTSKDSSLEHIEWVISPFRQKNFYIIGRICFSEGFKAGMERGYSLTLRQTDPESISSSTALHRILFERLRTYTLVTYPHQPPEADEHIALRLAALRCLGRSLKYCKSLSETQRHRRPSISKLGKENKPLRKRR
jgi:hypothetical protein